MFRWMTLSVGLGALVPLMATLAAEPAIQVLRVRYSEMISSVATLGLFAGFTVTVMDK